MSDNRNLNLNELKKVLNQPESSADQFQKAFPRLDELALKAFLRARKEFDWSEIKIPPEYNTVIEQQILKLVPDFLQAIANANPVEVKKMLDDCPELAVVMVAARGTVTGASGYTYENVSAVELAYLMDDDELMREVLLPAIKELPEDKIKEAETQLANKMTEVEKQRVQFKPYDFSEMVKAIANDQTLKNTGNPSEATQKALEKFKGDFKPGTIKEGKSLIKEQLQEAHRVYDANWDPWSGTQLSWYLINIVGHMQTLVETCFEQECSQGLKEIVDQKKPNARSVKIKNWMNDATLTYRASADSSLVLGRDFFVDIVFGAAGRGAVGRRGHGALKNYVEQKHQDFQKLSSSFNVQQRNTK